MTVETFDRVSEAREVGVLEKGRRMLKSVLPLWLKMAFQSCLRAANDEGDAGVATEGVSVEEGMVEFDIEVTGSECVSGAECTTTARLKSDGGVVVSDRVKAEEEIESLSFSPVPSKELNGMGDPEISGEKGTSCACTKRSKTHVAQEELAHGGNSSCACGLQERVRKQRQKMVRFGPTEYEGQTATSSPNFQGKSMEGRGAKLVPRSLLKETKTTAVPVYYQRWPAFSTENDVDEGIPFADPTDLRKILSQPTRDSILLLSQQYRQEKAAFPSKSRNATRRAKEDARAVNRRPLCRDWSRLEAAEQTLHLLLGCALWWQVSLDNPTKETWEKAQDLHRKAMHTSPLLLDELRKDRDTYETDNNLQVDLLWCHPSDTAPHWNSLLFQAWHTETRSETMRLFAQDALERAERLADLQAHAVRSISVKLNLHAMFANKLEGPM